MIDTPQFLLGEQILRVLVDTVEDYGMIALDLEGRVVHWNAGAVHTLGYSRDEVLGRYFSFLFTDEDRESGVPEQELRVAITHGRSEDERWHVRKDGSRFWSLGILLPAVDPESGVLLGFGKILRDRSDLKQLQETLRNQAVASAEADEGKAHFLATLAHELRNPLAVFMSGVTLLKKQGESSSFARITEMMERQVLHTQKLVEDLLDVARIGRKKLELQRRDVDLRDILRQASAMAHLNMQDRGHYFAGDIPKTPLMVWGDEHRLTQVFVNLLNNAAKFSDANGAITLVATAEGNEAVVRVVDKGIGIAPDQLVSIFELFSQVNSSRPESHLGLGIGLALTRDLVTLHGGTIQARSEGLGKGSEFIVRLPLISGIQQIT